MKPASFPELYQEARQCLVSETGVPPAQVRGVYSPYRICPLGAHIDHQGGAVLGCSIDTGTVLAFAPLDEPRVSLFSLQFGDRVNFKIGQEIDLDHWVRYALAAARVLAARSPVPRGLVGVVNGSLVGAGLSSSASVGLAYLRALAHVNHLSLTKFELVRLNQQLENGQLGLQNGILDQTSILFGASPGLLHIGTKPFKVEPMRRLDGDYAWLVVSSGQQRSLARSDYNARVEECRQAARLLQPGAQRLGEVPVSVFIERGGLLPEPLRKRATHFFGEADRVAQGVEAWNAGDIELFGELMNESCASSFAQYESGNDQLRFLHESASRTWGVCGSRFSGGGYGGCLVALVRSLNVSEAALEILDRYGERYPELAEKAVAFIPHGGGGLRIVDERGLEPLM